METDLELEGELLRDYFTNSIINLGVNNLIKNVLGGLLMLEKLNECCDTQDFILEIEAFIILCQSIHNYYQRFVNGKVSELSDKSTSIFIKKFETHRVDLNRTS
jgi:hypothetical protein